MGKRRENIKTDILTSSSTSRSLEQKKNEVMKQTLFCGKSSPLDNSTG